MGRRRTIRRSSGSLTGAWWAAQRAADDDPPPHFAEHRDFREPVGPWTAREEQDYLDWVVRDAERYRASS